jgi:long-chain acyl-CoA synthetase
VADKYTTLVEALYGADDRVTIETQVIFEDGRSGALKAELLIRDVAPDTPVAVA